MNLAGFPDRVPHFKFVAPDNSTTRVAWLNFGQDLNFSIITVAGLNNFWISQQTQMKNMKKLSQKPLTAYTCTVLRNFEHSEHISHHFWQLIWVPRSRTLLLFREGTPRLIGDGDSMETISGVVFFWEQFNELAPIGLWLKFQCWTFKMKATQPFFHRELSALISINSVYTKCINYTNLTAGKSRVCDHSNESYWAVFACGTFHFFNRLKYEIIRDFSLVFY